MAMKPVAIGTGRHPATRSLFGLAILALLTSVAPVAAQEGEPEPLTLEPIPPDQVSGPVPVPDGQYAGSMGLNGRFSLTVEGVTVVWSGEAAGPVEFSVVESQLSGTWSMNGVANVGLSGLPLDSNSTSTWTTAGTVTAAGAGPYVVSSEASTGTSTATVSIPGLGPQTRSETFAIPPATGSLDRVVEVCGQISGNWDQRMQAGLAQLPGSTGSVRTYFTVLPVGVPEIQERIDDLLLRASELTADMSDIDLVVARMYGLVIDAEALLELIEPTDLPCDTDGLFMRIVTLQIQDVLHTLLTSWDELSGTSLDRVDLLRRLLIVGVRAGAIGAGSPDPAASAVLESLAAELAQQAFLEAVASDVLSDLRITDLAAIGLLLGIDYETAEGQSVSPSDLCLALGGCS